MKSGKEGFSTHYGHAEERLLGPRQGWGPTSKVKSVRSYGSRGQKEVQIYQKKERKKTVTKVNAGTSETILGLLGPLDENLTRPG